MEKYVKHTEKVRINTLQIRRKYVESTLKIRFKYGENTLKTH